MSDTTTARVQITWTKSTIHRSENQKRIIRALGLRKLNQTVEHDASPTIMGMLNKVPHLVTVKELQADA